MSCTALSPESYDGDPFAIPRKAAAMVPCSLLSALRQAPAIERGAGFPVWLQGEMPLGLWMLEAGALRISRISGAGKSVVIEVLEAGDLAGLAAAISDRPYETGAETAAACRLRFLPRTEFFRIACKDAQCSSEIALLLAAELAGVHRLIGNTILARSGSTRLAKFLLRASSAELTRLTHVELAGRIGVSRECVSRHVRDLKASGAISPERGCLAVRNRELLKRFAA